MGTTRPWVNPQSLHQTYRCRHMQGVLPWGGRPCSEGWSTAGPWDAHQLPQVKFPIHAGTHRPITVHTQRNPANLQLRLKASSATHTFAKCCTGTMYLIRVIFNQEKPARRKEAAGLRGGSATHRSQPSTEGTRQNKPKPQPPAGFSSCSCCSSDH